MNEQALLETISGNRQFAKLRNLYFSQFVQTVMASPDAVGFVAGYGPDGGVAV
ncbi:hypothetical protein [Faecalibaculum rodentium]|uniref:hypothetical protein n=1 Tax=Faecalibaculum rodentium TaxID=1702221 RepID=UPI00261285CC|nr:hypothetical protein [Faecalibaculum rodentium]